MDSDDNFEEIDLTGMDDEAVISVFKKMAPEDEIEVVQTGDGVEIKDNATGAEYRIELGGMDLDSEDEEEIDMDMDLDSEDEVDMDMDLDSEDEEEVEYHIEIDDEDEDDMDNMEEASRTYGAGKRFGRGLDKPKAAPRHLHQESRTPMSSTLVRENKVLKNQLATVTSENETLREDYNKMVDALKEFRQKLNEVAVFNSNLTYTVRLFTEHSTTKDEKVDIIKRFDDAKSLKESKNIYKSLVKEIYKTKSPIKESIDNKLNETKTSGSATQITESKVYVHPEMEKMKKLWEYDYKK
jgi:hypothetical protein